MSKDGIARRIRDARKRQALNQSELAAAIGVSRDTIWRLEKGENVHKDHVVAALRHLGLDEPGLTADAAISPRRQALARAWLRAYDSSPEMAVTLEAIAKPHLDAPGKPEREREQQLDVEESAGGSRSRSRTLRSHR